MTFKITSAVLLALVLTGCGGAEEVAKPQSTDTSLVVPSWVQNEAADQAGFNAVVTVSSALGEAAATKAAFAEVEAKMQAKFQAERDIRLLEISSQYSGLENSIRRQVAYGLPKLKTISPKVVKTFNNPEAGTISVWAQLSDADLTADFKVALSQMDVHLEHYIHISEKGSNFTQMLSILPALPALEIRRELKHYLAETDPASKNIQLPNDQLAYLLGVQLSNRFDRIVISVDATTEESLVYERSLTEQLRKVGFILSARKPDLLVKYFLEEESVVKNGLSNTTLVSDAEVIDDKGQTLASVSQGYQGLDRSKDVAAGIALSKFSTDIMTVVASSAIDFMDKVNKDIPVPAIYKR